MLDENMIYKFLAHAKKDHVAVAIADIRAGETVQGFFLEDDSTTAVSAIQDIPMGHKISLVSLEKGVAVKKYGQTIGAASAMIQAGEHVHVHNLTSARHV